MVSNNQLFIKCNKFSYTLLSYENSKLCKLLHSSYSKAKGIYSVISIYKTDKGLHQICLELEENNDSLEITNTKIIYNQKDFERLKDYPLVLNK